MRTRLALAAAACLLVFSSISHAQPKPEFRGVWVTRFEWTSPDPAECKAKITRIRESIAAANFNAVVFQIRGAADTLYPSKIEPWSGHLGGKDPGFDPVALAISEAHRLGLQFHAYINAMPMLEPRFESLPPPPEHLFNRHGPNSADSWLCVDRDGKPTRREYYWMSAGIPAVQAYVRSVIMDVVNRYDVDGIHLDRIRYPGPEYSYDAVSRQRFFSRGNPDLLDYADWQRLQVDKLVNDLAAEMRAVKPQVVFSCSAWGIYNRHNIDGYGTFSSGYHDYFQDTWAWCQQGGMDLLMPMIYWDMPDPKPNYDELLKDFIAGVGGDRVVGGQRMFGVDENEREIEVTREAGGFGTVLFSYTSAQRRGILDAARKDLYQEKAPVPQLARLQKPEYGVILGTVLADDGQPLVDAKLSLKTQDNRSGNRRGRRRFADPAWTSGADGRFAFDKVNPGTVQIVASYEGAAPLTSDPIEVKAGEVAKVKLTLPGTAELRNKPYLAILSPKDGTKTTEEVVHVLGRSIPGTQVTIAAQPVEVYATTGGFAKDNIPLQVGENRIEITAKQGDQSLTRVLTITRTAPPATAVAASAPAPAEESKPPQLDASTAGRIAETTSEGTGITYGLHEVRLGGPWLGFVPKGTRMEVLGSSSGMYKVRLSASTVGWISQRQAQLLPQGTPIPHNYFESCAAAGSDDEDTLSIHMRAPVAFAVHSEVDPSNRLYIDFYNTHDAMTWISHKSTARVLGYVRAEQMEENRVRLTVPLTCRQNWGYWTEVNDGMFVLHVRHPRKLAAAPDSPLKGLTIAIEAGHGGARNVGAMGLFGTKEKTINWEAALALQKELESRGAKVVQVRFRDENPGLWERAERANNANADFLVCIHANAAGTSHGFLRASGTSTYYNGLHCQLAATLIYDELLKLGWGEFGVVGNFSYTPLRNTRVPAILVEQAFMTNPADEARLLDPDYQHQQAAAIANGLTAFLERARE